MHYSDCKWFFFFFSLFALAFFHSSMQARMKLNGNMRVLDIGRKIDDLLKDVGLTSRRDVRIGSGIDDKVLSGGERKRLSFATEVWSIQPSSFSTIDAIYLFFVLRVSAALLFSLFPSVRRFLLFFFFDDATRRNLIERFYSVVNRSENIILGRANNWTRLPFGQLSGRSTKIVCSERTNGVVYHTSTEFRYIQFVRSNNTNCRGSGCIRRSNRSSSGVFCKVHFHTPCNMIFFHWKVNCFPVKDTSVHENTIPPTFW